MTAANRNIGDIDSSPQDFPGNQPPNFFTGTSFTVDQLAIDNQCLQTHLRSLRMAHSSRDAVGVKLASEAIARLAAQMHTLSAHLSGIAVIHINRRPRA